MIGQQHLQGKRIGPGAQVTSQAPGLPIDATGGTAAGMPPGTVFLYVFQR